MRLARLMVLAELASAPRAAPLVAGLRQRDSFSPAAEPALQRRTRFALSEDAHMRTSLGLYAALAIALASAVPAHGHWPGQPAHQMAELGDLQLESGVVIPNFRMSYVTHGTLNAAKDNAILFQHGFGGNHHLFDHMIGPGRPLDTDKRGHAALSHPPPARGGDAQVLPTEDHRSGDRLALPQRAKDGAKGMRRREFLTATSLGGAATLLGVRPTPAGAEPPPETNTLTLTHLATICFAPQYVAEELLRGEGFTDVHYAKLALGAEFYKALGSANVSLTMDLAASQLVAMDDGHPFVILAGVHVGCYQLF
jgi:hypothetical protein